MTSSERLTSPRDRFLPFARPDFDHHEFEAVREVLESGWITTGSCTRTFEETFAAAVGARHAVAVNSCTAAMHLALEAIGISRGDLVVTTPYTFAATAEVIRYMDAHPVFVDIDHDTLNIDPDKLDATLGGLASGDSSVLPPGLRGIVEPKPAAAVLPVHIAGLPCDLASIDRICLAHGASLVEDAAHAFPSVFAGLPIGARRSSGLPGATCFSFYATKTITTGEGGMLVTDDDAVADRSRMMSLHGISRNAWDRYTERGSWSYDILAAGFKYNLTDLASALGLAQLAKASRMCDRRRAIAVRYTEHFAGLDGVQLPAGIEDPGHAWHLYVLRVDEGGPGAITRAAAIEGLRDAGIGTSVHFIPLHLHSYYAQSYGYRPRDFPVALGEYERAVSLPIYSAMSDTEVTNVIKAVISLLRR